MRIAYLLKKFPRLSETFVLGEILRQEAAGGDIVVLARRPSDDEPRHPAFDDLRAPVYLVGEEGLNPWAELFRESPDAGVRFELLGETIRPLLKGGLPRLPKLVAEALWVLRRCQELQVSHIHVHFATESAIVAWMVAKLGGPTYSITAHAKDIYRSTVSPGMLTRLVEGSQFTVTVCDANVEYLSRSVEPAARDRIRRLYNGIDLSDFAFSRGARDAATILSVGRLVEKKGFDVLLRALALLKGDGRKFQALIIGEGEQRSEIETLRDSLGLTDIVKMGGAMDQAQVRRAMETATIFSLPCRVGEDGNRDALPTVLLEALAVGLPVVSTRVTGIPEILDQGHCGRLLAPEDPVATAKAMAELLDAPDERQQLALRGRAHAEEHFDGKAAAKSLRGWFEEVRERALVP